MHIDTNSHRNNINHAPIQDAGHSRESIIEAIGHEEKSFREAMKADVPFEAVKQIRERINKLTGMLHVLRREG